MNKVNLNNQFNIIPLFMVGLISVPSTFQTRNGSFLVASIIIFFLIIVGYSASKTRGTRMAHTIKSYILGVFFSEILFLAYWGLSNGFNDGYGIMFSIYVGIFEFVALSLLGVLSLVFIKLFLETKLP